MGLAALHCIPKFVKNHTFHRKYFSSKLRLAEQKIFYRGLQDSQDTQDSQNTQDTQDSQDTQDTQDSQDTKDSRHSSKIMQLS
jgi:hypothetical protein